MDYWKRLDAWKERLEIMHGRCPLMVKALLEEANVVLPAGDDEGSIGALVNAVQTAIEAVFTKLYNHLGENVIPVGEKDGTRKRAAVVRSHLEIYQRRECWDLRHLPVVPTSNDALESWILKGTGSIKVFADADIFVHYENLRADITASSASVPEEHQLLPVPKLPVAAQPKSSAVASPVADGEDVFVDPGNPQVNEDEYRYIDKLVAFWKTVATRKERYGTFGDLALRALSIPFSQNAVERSFAVLSNREVNNRLRGDTDYVQDMLTLSCNKDLYLKLVLEQADKVQAEVEGSGSSLPQA